MSCIQAERVWIGCIELAHLQLPVQLPAQLANTFRIRNVTFILHHSKYLVPSWLSTFDQLTSYRILKPLSSKVRWSDETIETEGRSTGVCLLLLNSNCCSSAMTAASLVTFGSTSAAAVIAGLELTCSTSSVSRSSVLQERLQFTNIVVSHV